MKVGCFYRRSRRMGEWLSANGARIRACAEAGERERLLALHRQREPIYDAAYARFWEAWSASQTESVDASTTHGGGQETLSGPDPVSEDPRVAAVLAKVDEYWAETNARVERNRTRPPQSMYEQMTGEPIEAALARNAAEVNARQVLDTSVDDSSNLR